MRKAKTTKAKQKSPNPESEPIIVSKPLNDFLKILDQILTPDERKNFTKEKLTSILLTHFKIQFDETKNPVHVVESFIGSHFNHRCPDQWVLDFIANVFINYLFYDGEKSLDFLFGFKRGPGKQTAFKENVKKERDSALMVEMNILNYILGYSINDAAYMIAQRLEVTAKETVLAK